MDTRTTTAGRTLASLRIGRVPGSRSARSLLARAREWTTAAVLLVAVPAAGCLSTADMQGVEAELSTIAEQIAVLEADDRDGTPITVEQRAELQALYSQREHLAAYRRVFGPDTGSGEVATWISRFMTGDPTAIGTGVGSVVAALYGRKKYRDLKAKRAAKTPGGAGPANPIEPTPSVEATNGETLEGLTRALLEAKPTPKS